MSEEPRERAEKYIGKFADVIQKIVPQRTDTKVKAANIERISDTIHRYLQDARFYLEHGKPTTALASVAYAEGLLDALNFLELTKTKTTQ
jgi:hypothetical protein